MKIGYFLSCEEYTPAELVEQAALAEEAGFDALWISDHFHPWNNAQGESPLVWSVIGALSQVCDLPVTTAVTCPIMRVHPAIIAQAAATSAVLLDDQFVLGVGTGEALNEHITGRVWPGALQRLDMLVEAIELIRALWSGDVVDFRGEYFEASRAQIYTMPDVAPPIYMSGFGPISSATAGRVADGFISTKADPSLVETFRHAGGSDRTAQGGYKVAWSDDDDAAIDAAHRLWPQSGLPGEAAQELPSPRHFEQLSTLVTREQTRDAIAYGDNVPRHVEVFRRYAAAGYDEIYIAQMGGRTPRCRYEGFFDFYRSEVLPELRAV